MQSSTYILDAHTQADGRRYCTEVHVDNAGREHRRLYKVPLGWTSVEIEARLAQSAQRIDESLAESEAAALMEQT